MNTYPSSKVLQRKIGTPSKGPRVMGIIANKSHPIIKPTEHVYQTPLNQTNAQRRYTTYQIYVWEGSHDVLLG
jgi:hypothetical protein